MGRRAGQPQRSNAPLTSGRPTVAALDDAAVAAAEKAAGLDSTLAAIPPPAPAGQPEDPGAELLQRSPARRMVALLRVLESAAILTNDQDAAKAALLHHRWRVEMSQGKAPIRGSLDVRQGVTVVDDLGHAAPAVPQDVAGQRRQRALSPVVIDASSEEGAPN